MTPVFSQGTPISVGGQVATFTSMIRGYHFTAPTTFTICGLYVPPEANAAGTQTIRVADNGPGLAPKARDNLFVPFAGSTRAGGFGLGLPIARELLRAQGGDVTLLSSTPQGTCFVVRLPL